MFRTLKNTFKKKMLGYTDSNKNHYPVLKYKIVELRLKSKRSVSCYTKEFIYSDLIHLYMLPSFEKHIPSPSFPIRLSTEDTFNYSYHQLC